MWRNIDKDSTGSNSKAGQTNYDDLYANIVLWLKEGWIDYVAPQLYWEFEHAHAPFGPLLDWWNKHSYGRHCYIGLGIFKAGSNASWRDKDELPRQIRELRNMPNVEGAIYFSSKSFEKNPNGWNDSLQNNYYKYPAIIPAMPWIDSAVLAKPVLSIVANGSNAGTIIINIQNAETVKKIKAFVVYAFDENDSVSDKTKAQNIVKIIPATANPLQYIISQTGNKIKKYGVSCVDFENNESELSSDTGVNKLP